MNWTKEPPTKEGWYRIKDAMRFKVAKYSKHGDGMRWTFAGSEGRYVTEFLIDNGCEFGPEVTFEDEPAPTKDESLDQVDATALAVAAMLESSRRRQAGQGPTWEEAARAYSPRRYSLPLATPAEFKQSIIDMKARNERALFERAFFAAFQSLLSSGEERSAEFLANTAVAYAAQAVKVLETNKPA